MSNEWRRGLTYHIAEEPIWWPSSPGVEHLRSWVVSATGGICFLVDDLFLRRAGIHESEEGVRKALERLEDGRFEIGERKAPWGTMRVMTLGRHAAGGG